MKIDFMKDWILTKDDNSSLLIDLPYDAMIKEQRYQKCVNGKESAFFPGKKYTYTKKFNINRDNNKYFAILFEGVYRNATVKLNSKKVAFTKYGFTEFLVDISRDVFDGENILEVEVDNSLTPNARFYVGSGIYRPVTLIIKKEKQIDMIKITTTDYKKGKINIYVETKEIVNVAIFDKNNNIVYEGKAGEIVIPNHELWSEFSPYLYKAVITTSKDKEEVTFGIRAVEFISGQGLFVNGVKTILKGVCLHADNGILGANSYKEVEYNKVRKLKEAGFNAIRSAHNPCSRYILEACDYYGVYLIDELYDGWYIPKNYHDHARNFSREQYTEDLMSMINKDLNHPSVIAYSLGNELTEVAYPRGLDILQEMTALCHALDDTRVVTCGINLLICVYAQLGLGIYKDKGEYKPFPLKDTKARKEKKSGSSFFNYWIQKLGKILFFISKGKRAEKIAREVASRLDVIGLNYGSSRYDIDTKKYPKRLMIGSETFIQDMPYNYKRLHTLPNLIGDFLWVGFDYLGEAGFGDWTYYSYGGLPVTYGSGLFDILGNRTAQLDYAQVAMGIIKKPVIVLRPVNHYKETPRVSAWKLTNAIRSYNFHGYENKRMIVEVYTTAPYIELFQNEKSLGVRRVKNNIAFFKGKYQLGKLKAIALDKDKNMINSNELSSGDNNPHIHVELTKDTITTAASDVIFGNIEIHNDNNELLPCYEEEIQIVTSKYLELIALGSGLSNNKEDYNSNKHHTYRGQLGFAVKAKQKCDDSYIKISGKNLDEKEIKINIIESDGGKQK
ncbi:MAG: glycoside hydrolase family 2 protein [Clostridiales bacterium]|nr:glycoside hydrolase family 2 protein [Clostridiales bacterium]